MRLVFVACVIALCVLVLARPARAGFADPARSYEDPCLVVCPAGDSTFMMVLRNSAGNPWLVDEVTLNFCDCPRVSLVPGVHSYQVLASGCQIGKYPYADGTDGTVLFPIAAGGVCGDSVRVLCGGIPFHSRAVASFDQDGDLFVTQADLDLIQAKLLTADPTADFNCDGVVTSADLEIAQGHLGHGAATGVPGVDRWGAAFGFSRSPAPNPARAGTSFAIANPRQQPVDLFVADLLGRRVATLWNGSLPVGEHRFTWSPEASPGRGVRAGVYVVVARAGDHAVVKRLAIIR
jgi:hypothetical protein